MPLLSEKHKQANVVPAVLEVGNYASSFRWSGHVVLYTTILRVGSTSEVNKVEHERTLLEGYCWSGVRGVRRHDICNVQEEC